jgi:single-strand DNA-binding protein
MPNGDPVCNFSVATSEEWKDKQTGEKKEQTEWHDVTVFKHQGAEFAGTYFKKGSSVLVVGKMNTREWEKDGQKHRRKEVKAISVQFVGSKGGEPAEKKQDFVAGNNPPPEDFEDDIPF